VEQRPDVKTFGRFALAKFGFPFVFRVTLAFTRNQS
jgi:hypothetical protein